MRCYRCLPSRTRCPDLWGVSHALAFVVTVSPPQWQTTRWSAQEIGRHFVSSGLMRLGEWYTKLNGVSLLYQRLLTELQHLQTADGKYRMNKDVGDGAVRQIQEYPPPLPDAKLNSGKSIADYLADLRQRQPNQPQTSSPATEAPETAESRERRKSMKRQAMKMPRSPDNSRRRGMSNRVEIR